MQGNGQDLNQYIYISNIYIERERKTLTCKDCDLLRLVCLFVICSKYNIFFKESATLGLFNSLFDIITKAHSFYTTIYDLCCQIML